MKSELLAKSPLLLLPLGALFVFLTVFIAVVAITMKRRNEAYESLARLPFGEEGDSR